MVRITSKCPKTHKPLWSKEFDFVTKYITNTENLTIVILNIHNNVYVCDSFRIPGKQLCRSNACSTLMYPDIVRVQFLNIQIQYIPYIFMLENLQS